MKITPRNIVNIVLLLVSSIALAIFSLGVVDAPWVGQAQTLAGGLLAGLLIPGSPIGRILDSVFPGAAEQPAPIDAATVEAAAEMLKQKPPQRITGRDGFVSEPVLWAVVVCAFAFLVTAAVHGCGAQLSDSQRGALAVETQRCIVNERAIVDRAGTSAEQDAADLAAERARCDAARANITGGAQ